MANNETLALAEAVRLTLAYCGAEVFGDPQRFMAYLDEMTNDRSDEMRVLRNNCTAELLAPFKRADVMTSVDLKRAAGAVEEYLVEECLINATTSRIIARGIAEGAARWRELTINWGDTVPKNEDSHRESVAPGRWRKALFGVLALGLLVGGIALAVPQIATIFQKLSFVGGPAEQEEGIWLRTSMETKLANGDVSDAWTRTYDHSGNILSSDDETLVDDGGTFTFSRSYGGYDSYGYPAWSRSSNVRTEADGTTAFQDRGTYDYTYEMDSRGRLKSRHAKSESSSWFESSGWESEPTHDVETTTYTYEGNNLLKEESQSTYTHGDYSSQSTSFTEYDRYGDMTRHGYRNVHNGEVFSTYDDATSYKRRSDGTIRSYRETISSSYEDEVTVTSVTVTCDKHGIMTEETRTEDGVTTTTRYENKYDDNGNLVRQKNLTDGSVTTYEYIYIENPSFGARHDGW